MSLRKAAELLKAAKRAAGKDDAALSKTIQAVEYILGHVTAKERRESNDRVAPNAVRKVTRQQ